MLAQYYLSTNSGLTLSVTGRQYDTDDREDQLGVYKSGGEYDDSQYDTDDRENQLGVYKSGGEYDDSQYDNDPFTDDDSEGTKSILAKC